MSRSLVRLERDGPMAVVTLACAEARNALDVALLAELLEVLHAVADDAGVRALVLAAEGDDFSVGWDLGQVVENGGPPAAGGGVPAIEALANLPIPTIAAIHGHALGGGLELALACDLRLAADDAQLGLPEVRLGLLPWGGGTQRLPRIVGRAKALEMILLGTPVDAAEALRIGLVTRTVPQSALRAEAIDLAASLARLGPIALRYGKEAVVRGMDLSFDQGLRLEMDLSVLLQTTADRAEGIRAFLEKRPPTFGGS